MKTGLPKAQTTAVAYNFSGASTLTPVVIVLTLDNEDYDIIVLDFLHRMEIYREVCNALERLYERSAGQCETTSPAHSPSRSHSDTSLTLSPADANFQVNRRFYSVLR